MAESRTIPDIRQHLRDRMEPLCQKMERHIEATRAQRAAKAEYDASHAFDKQLALRDAEAALLTVSLEWSGAIGEFVDGLADVLLEMVKPVKRTKRGGT